MKLSDSLRLRLVIAIALIGLLAVLAAWFASRQVVLEETAALGRLGAEESGEMARVREAVEDIAEAFHEQGGWTPTARRAHLPVRINSASPAPTDTPVLCSHASRSSASTACPGSR